MEALESRDLLAQVSLIGGVLSVIGNPTGTTAFVSQPQPDTVQVVADGQTTTWKGVTSIAMFGGAFGPNDLSNFGTSLPATIVGGPKGDVLQGGGGSDIIICGTGRDKVYDILGTNQVVSLNGSVPDTLFVNAASQTLSKKNDSVVKMFDTGRTPGSGSVQFVNGVLYLTPSNEGTFTLVSQVGKTTQATVNYNGAVKTLSFQNVKYIGYFGGSGDDRYINNTKINDLAYGGVGAGNDVMIGGLGQSSFMKGGNGNDTLIGRATKEIDLAGNGGNDVLMNVANSTAVMRGDPLADFFVGRRKVLFG
jgi:hypothetical protein